MLNDGAANRVDPVLLLLIGIGDEVHRIGARGEFEGVGFVEDVFGALDGKTGGDGDDAAWLGDARDGGVFEPEELALFEDEPAAAPGFDVLALFCEPAGAFGVGPEFNAVVVGWRLRLAGRRAPQAVHRMKTGRREKERIRTTHREQNHLTLLCWLRSTQHFFFLPPIFPIILFGV